MRSRQRLSCCWRSHSAQNCSAKSPILGHPSSLPPAKIAALRDKLTRAGGRLSITGLSYYDGNLYAGTNLGLCEIQHGEISRLWRFQEPYSLIFGPWEDEADHLLWAADEQTRELLRFDGENWARIRKTAPFDGNLLIGNSQGFWLASAGIAWRWDQPSQRWQPVSQKLSSPQDFTMFAQIIGVVPVGQTPLLIVRHEALPYLLKAGDNFHSDEVIDPTNGMRALEAPSKAFLADKWSVAQDAAYICTEARSLVEVTMEGLVDLVAPGECEAVTRNSGKGVLVSIKNKGIYEYSRKGGWGLLANHPYPTGKGDYWVYLATANGQVAFAMAAKPVVDLAHADGSDMRFIENAAPALWTLKDGSFVSLPLP